MSISRRRFVKTATLAAAALACSPRVTAESPAMAGIACGGEHTRQLIDGFGFSEAFQAAGLTRLLSDQDQAALLNLMFLPAGGMGYSILRNQIGDNPTPRPNSGDTQAFEPEKGKFVWTGDENAIWLMNEARKRGCTRFFSSAWSPPSWMKTNGALHDGALKKECYQDFADYLATYVLEYKSRFGLDIYAISPANEPGFIPTENYSSCRWSAAELTKFLRDNLIPTFKAKNVTAEVVIDEHNNWTEEYIAQIIADPVVNKAVHIVAAHAYADDQGGPYVAYGTRTGQFPESMKQGKRIWQTEVSAGNAQILNMNDGVYWARVLHKHMVEDNVSAWLYWWGAAPSNTRSGLIWVDAANKKYQLSKRFFTIGQYARFIRPGYHRVDATPNPVQGKVDFSAYMSPDSKKLVCVAINDDVVEHLITIQPGGFPATSCTAVRTSNTETHTKLPPVHLTNGAATVVTTPLSVTTYIFRA